MPYSRYNRRSYAKRRGPYRGRVNWSKSLSTASKALTLARQVKQMVNVEYKHHTKTETALDCVSTVSPVCLCLIPSGDVDTKRDGSKVRAKWITFNYTLTMHASAVSTVVRVMLVIDTQTNQTAFSGSDLLLDTSIADNIVSPLNLDNAGRFRVIYDRYHSFSVNANRIIARKVYKKLNLPLKFDASTPGIEDLTQNSIHLVCFSTEATYEPKITYISRIRYIDN